MIRTSTARRRDVATLAAGALAALLTLTACGSQVAGSGSGDLPLLRIGAGAYAGDVRAAVAGATGSGPDRYPLSGSLPTGPATATVVRFGTAEVPQPDVEALASALGLGGTPVRHAHGWELATSDGVLRVRDGGTAWSFARGPAQCPAYSVDVDADGGVNGVGCAVASPPGSTPSATTPVPDDAAARAAADPVLAAVGLDAASARVLPAVSGYGVRTVVLAPAVDGRPTSGARTLVDVDRLGVLGALGVIATPTPGDAYPIITAAAALDLLRSMPQPELAIACAIGQKCPGIGPRVVTGARLGLTMAYDGSGPILVPAWLFTIQGSDDPTPVIAVERAYLADPEPGAGATASAVPPAPGASDGGSGSSPGSSGAPDSPVPVPPGDSSGLTPGGTSPTLIPVESVALGKDGRTLVLGATGGVCDTYLGRAIETPTTITVSITTGPPQPDRVCAAVVKEFSVTVVLAAPWDDRSVVDAVSGRTIPVG
jgi:hypothetical protein